MTYEEMKNKYVRMRKRYGVVIGIDTGTHTGFAVWNVHLQRFEELSTLPIHKAMKKVLEWQVECVTQGVDLLVRFEDARQRKWYGTYSRKQDIDKLQGAGSIKRDCNIWEDFLTDEKIDFNMVAPKNNTTKMNAAAFQNLTKWEKKTSEHARDAAMLVFGYKS